MKQSQFFGWVKKAYPEVQFKFNGGDIWFSPGRYVQVIAKSSGVVEFLVDTLENLKEPKVLEDDSEIISYIRNIWGEPKVAFSFSEPKKSQPRTTAKDLLEELKTSSDVEIIKVPGGEAVKINGSKLVLYDLGISSKPSEFIPWAREEEVKECIENFIKQNNYE